MKKGVFLLYLILMSLCFFCCEKTPTTPEVPNYPVILSFTANPSEISYGESSTLSWSVSNATSAEIDQGIGTVPLSGSKEVNPKETTSYTLTATNSDGSTTKTCKIEVNKAAFMIIDGNIKRTYTSYGCPRFEGYVKNVGNATGWNCGVDITCYSDAQKTTIIDVAYGFPANLGDIRPGQRAYFEAVAFDCKSHDQIKAIDVKITWLNREGMKFSQTYPFIF